MRLHYFAWVRTRIGVSSEELSLPDDITHVSDLIAYLNARGGGYAKAFSNPALIRVAINQAFSSRDQPISDRDEVAFFPPVTGG